MPARTPEELHQLLAAAFNAGDLDAFVELYDPGATLLVPPGGELARGREDIRAAVSADLSTLTRFRSEVLGKLEAGSIALTHARWRALASGAGETGEMSGRGTVVSRRQPDGSWLILLDDPITPA